MQQHDQNDQNDQHDQPGPPAPATPTHSELRVARINRYRTSQQRVPEIKSPRSNALDAKSRRHTRDDDEESNNYEGMFTGFEDIENRSDEEADFLDADENYDEWGDNNMGLYPDENQPRDDDADDEAKRKEEARREYDRTRNLPKGAAKGKGQSHNTTGAKTRNERKKAAAKAKIAAKAKAFLGKNKNTAK